VNLGSETQGQSIGRVALGGDGTAVAAWAQFEAGSSVLQVARRKPGEGYTSPVTVPGTTGVQSSSVRVGVDGAGNATVLYELGGSIVVVPWPGGAGAPGAAQTVGAGGFGELAVGRGGTAVATWLENPASMSIARVRAAVRPGPSGDFGGATTISDFGDGPAPTITGLRAAVGDGGHATVAWARDTLTPNIIVLEANERAPGGNFSATGTPLSPAVAPDLSSEPAVAVDRSGRSTVLWTRSGQIRYAEHGQGEPFWSTEQRVSAAAVTESQPAVGAAATGAVIAAWAAGGSIATAARPSGGGAFAGFRTLSGPAMNTSLPLVAVGRDGDALISWSLGDGKAIPTVQRNANGTFGPVLTAVTAANQPPGESHSYFQPSIGIDDEGNGVAAWTRTANRNATDFWQFQTASFDAAAPALTSSVPPGGKVGAPIGMAAAASDRVSPVAIHWAFGDGSTASGGAVSHAFGSAGAFNVTVTASDVAGNVTSATHPVLIGRGKKKRVRATVSVTWGVTSTRTYLLRLKLLNVPKRGKAQLRCTGKKCPFKRVSSKKRRKGDITLFKEIKPTKAAGKKKRTFRPGQRLELRITKKAFIGQVVRYKLRRNKIPSGKALCLPVGKNKPRKRCP
jgi:hypothetical protein